MEKKRHNVFIEKINIPPENNLPCITDKVMFLIVEIMLDIIRITMMKKSNITKDRSNIIGYYNL